MLKVVNGVLPSLLEGVRGFDHTAENPITDEDLLFVDVARENGKVNAFGGGAALVCFVLVTILILVSVSTVMLWKQKEHSKKKNLQEDWDLARPETRCQRIAKCFSLLDNVNLLVKPTAKRGDSELEVLNGVRVIFCAQIIMGNTFFYILRGPL